MVQYGMAIGEGEVLLPSLGGVFLWVVILAAALFRRRPPERMGTERMSTERMSVERPNAQRATPAAWPHGDDDPRPLRARQDGRNESVWSEHRNGERNSPHAHGRGTGGSRRSHSPEGGISPRRATLDDDLHKACRP